MTFTVVARGELVIPVEPGFSQGFFLTSTSAGFLTHGWLNVGKHLLVLM